MSNELTNDERAELEALRKVKSKTGNKGLYLQVSQKGAVSLYGMGRFPVTLYKEQLLKVIAHMEVIQQFIADHDSELKTKEARD